MAACIEEECLELRLPTSHKATQRDLEQMRVIELSAKEFDAFAAALEEPIPTVTRDLLARAPMWGQ